jgi:HTH-type transcriptional regulator, quorum sensing regulator NprR
MLDGEKIYYHRIKKSITQGELCKGICSVSYLSKIENNKIEANLEIIELLFNRLGITYDDKQPSRVELKKKLNSWYRKIKERKYEEAKRLKEEISYEITRIEDPTILCLFNIFTARFYILNKDLQKAEEYLLKVEKMDKFFSDELSYYQNSFWGLLDYLKGNLEEALRLYQKAEKYSSPAKIVEPEFVYQLSIIYSRLGKNFKSILSAHRALTEFDNNANYERSVDCHILIGISYYQIGDYDIAKDYLSKALNATNYLPDPIQVNSIIYYNMALIYSREKDHDNALKMLWKSIDYDNDIDLQRSYLLAKEYYGLGNMKESQRWLLKGLADANNKPSTYFFKIKMLEMKMKNREDSNEYLFLMKEAKEFFKGKRDQINLHMCYEKLGNYYAKRFSYKDACECYLMANKIQYELK